MDLHSINMTRCCRSVPRCHHWAQRGPVSVKYTLLCKLVKATVSQCFRFPWCSGFTPGAEQSATVSLWSFTTKPARCHGDAARRPLPVMQLLSITVWHRFPNNQLSLSNISTVRHFQSRQRIRWRLSCHARSRYVSAHLGIIISDVGHDRSIRINLKTVLILLAEISVLLSLKDSRRPHSPFASSAPAWTACRPTLSLQNCFIRALLLPCFLCE